jgi:phage terminase large subunit-like protein
VVRHRSKKRGQPPLSRSERAIKWFEDYLTIPEGRYVGKPLKVAEFMKEDFRAIYDNPQGSRRAIISRGRKNGKTIEAAMVVLLHLCGVEARRNSQLYSTALSRDQAALLFNLAGKMIRLSPELNASVVIRETQKTLSCPGLGTVYRALSAEATTAFGLSPAVVVHDELGQVRGPRSALYEAH